MIIIRALRHILQYETYDNFKQRRIPKTTDNKNEPTLVNCSQLQAGATLKQLALKQTLISNNWCLVFVKVELIPYKQYQMNPLKSRDVPPRSQIPASYPGIS